MRLRLMVQRHGLPPVQLLWTAGHVLPAPYATAGSSITISQFVEQVNDIIPLESDDWGLEDYAVEVRGFECLHFSEVGQVLREEDEVCIRPLQTSDLCVRRITGRHQISADGKHLIDGVAFGRPFLRKADRPAIRIPPRKRRRLTYDEEEDINDTEELVNDRQIEVRAGFDNADKATARDESDDEEDFTPDDEEDEDFGAELEDLQDDLNAGANEGGMMVGNVQDQSTRTTRARKSPKGLGLLQLLDDNGRPFAGQYQNPLLDMYGRDEPSHRQPALKVRKRSPATLTQRARKTIHNGTQESSACPERVNRRSPTGSNKSVRFEDKEPATPATVREFEDSDEADDSDFELAEVDGSDKENAEPQAEDIDTSTDPFDSSDSSSSTFSELQPSDSEETSSSGSSSSDPSSDSEPEQQSSKLPGHETDSSETSSSDSSGSSDSESEAPITEAPKTELQRSEERKAAQRHQWAMEHVKIAPVKETAEPVHSSSPPTTVAPNEGAKRTKKRNERRRKSNKLAYLKGKGLLPANANNTDYQGFLEGNQVGETTVNEAVEQPQKEDVGHSVEFEAKRQALLASITSGGVDVYPALKEEDVEPELPKREGRAHAGDDMDVEAPNSATIQPSKPIVQVLTSVQSIDVSHTPDQADMEPELPQADRQARVSDSMEAQNPVATQHDEPMADSPTSAKDTQGLVMESVVDKVRTGTPTSSMEQSSKESPTPATQHRRSKLDLSGTKRMLFGSLGLRTPKTQEDESKMREKLMKDMRPVKQPEPNKEVETVDDVTAAAADDSWQEKVDLRAVECCYDGIELSTPPFPFVQRWDPQQQGRYNYGTNKKRKGKKRKRNNDSYYEEDSYQIRHTEAGRYNEYDTPRHESEQERPNENGTAEIEQQKQGHLHDENLKDSIKVSEQLQRETEDVSERTLVEAGDTQDLPLLPEDPTTCPHLTRETATTGTIIAFKQFVMSAGTNWQPSISEYQTAIIKEVMDDGILQMDFAKRDQPARDIRYDEQTGKRIYGKFEMPGFSDDEDEHHGGKVISAFEDLIEPILVQTSDVGQYQNQEQQSQGNSHSAPQGGSNDTATQQNGHDATSQPFAGLDGAADEVMKVEAIMPSEETRQEIFELIRDAGWRSSIGSGINGILDAHQEDNVTGSNDNNEDTAPADAPSPKFHGFSSSPAFDAIEVASSPLPAEIQVAKSEHVLRFEIADSLPPPDPPRSDAPSTVSDTKLTVDYPDLPQVGDESYAPQVGDDSDLFHEEAQHRSDPLGVNEHNLSQDLSSINGMDQPPAQSTRSRTRPSQEKSSPNISKTRDHPTDSEEEFPPLFSQAFEARMSQEIDIKPEISSQDASISPPAKRKSRMNGTQASSQREPYRDWKPEGEWSGFEDDAFIEDDGGSTPRASQPPVGSQIVDLTISSDHPHTIYSDDDDDSYMLPSGPGWVKKSRTSGARNVPAKANSRRRTTKSR